MVTIELDNDLTVNIDTSDPIHKSWDHKHFTLAMYFSNGKQGRTVYQSERLHDKNYLKFVAEKYYEDYLI